MCRWREGGRSCGPGHDGDFGACGEDGGDRGLGGEDPPLLAVDAGVIEGDGCLGVVLEIPERVVDAVSEAGSGAGCAVAPEALGEEAFEGGFGGGAGGGCGGEFDGG